jgi:hypothetical protein
LENVSVQADVTHRVNGPIALNIFQYCSDKQTFGRESARVLVTAAYAPAKANLRGADAAVQSSYNNAVTTWDIPRTIIIHLFGGTPEGVLGCTGYRPGRR